MNYSQIDKLEYKAPAYELCDRENISIDFDSHLKLRRYSGADRKNSFTSAVGGKNSISLLFGGDLLCQPELIKACKKQDGGYDFSLCFEYIKPLLQSADFTAASLRTPVSHTAPYQGEILSHEGPRYYNAPVAYLEALSQAGFDMLTTEGNHCLDAGARGLLETIENIRNFGIIPTGTSEPEADKYVIVDIYGFKVGITAFGGNYSNMRRNLTAEGKAALLNPFSFDAAAEIRTQMIKAGAEYTICLPFWGKEYDEELTDKQIETARSLSLLGFDLVLGSHTHVLQHFNLVNGKPVAFSLGDLLSVPNSKKKGTEYTTLCHVKLTRTENSIETDIEFIPCKLLKGYKGIPYTVLPVSIQMGITDSQEPLIAKTGNRVLKRLNCKSSRIRMDYPVNSDTFLNIRSFEMEALPARLAALSPAEKHEKLIPAVEMPQELVDDKAAYRVEKKCLYKLNDKHADLVLFGRTGEIVTLPRKVANLPVRNVSAGDVKNSTTRLIYLGRSVHSIGDEAFADFTALESVRIFKWLKTVGNKAFANCSSLTGIILPKNAQEIGTEAFLNCSNLRSIKIPPKVTAIGENAFAGCEKLTIYCEKDSFADSYAQTNKIPVKYMPLTAQAATAEADDDDDEGDAE